MAHAEVYLRKAVVTREPKIVLAVDKILLDKRDALSRDDVVVKGIRYQSVLGLIVIAEGAASRYHPYGAVLVLMDEGRHAGGQLLWCSWQCLEVVGGFPVTHIYAIRRAEFPNTMTTVYKRSSHRLIRKRIVFATSCFLHGFLSGKVVKDGDAIVSLFR